MNGTSLNQETTFQYQHLPRYLSFALTGLLLLGATLSGGLLAAQAAESYPQRPIRLIVPAGPGGSGDTIGRLVASTLEQTVGWRLVVDDRPGGGTVIGTELAARATPDGYTLFLATAAFGTIPSLIKRLPYDPIKDFSPISLFAQSPLIFVVPPSLGVHNMRELIQLAKSRPGQFNYGISQLGSGGHLSMELLEWMADIKLIRIAYRGAPLALVDLVGGRIQVVCTNPVPAMPYVKTGKLRALAQTGRSRSPALSNIPAVAETVPGYDSTVWFAFLAPAGTPPQIIKRLQLEIAKIARSPMVTKPLLSQAVETIGSDPQELTRHIKVEIDRWAKVIERAQIRPN